MQTYTVFWWNSVGSQSLCFPLGLQSTHTQPTLLWCSPVMQCGNRSNILFSSFQEFLPLPKQQLWNILQDSQVALCPWEAHSMRLSVLRLTLGLASVAVVTLRLTTKDWAHIQARNKSSLWNDADLSTKVVLKKKALKYLKSIKKNKSGECVVALSESSVGYSFSTCTGRRWWVCPASLWWHRPAASLHVCTAHTHTQPPHSLGLYSVSPAYTREMRRVELHRWRENFPERIWRGERRFTL